MAQVPASGLERGSGGSRGLVIAAGYRTSTRAGVGFLASSGEVVFFVADHVVNLLL